MKELYKKKKTWIMCMNIDGQSVHRSTGETEKRKAMAVKKREIERIQQVKGETSPGAETVGNKSITLSQAIKRGHDERWKYTSYGRQVRNRLYGCLDVIGDLPLPEIDESHINQVTNKLRNIRNSQASINRVLAHLRTLFRMAKLEWKVLDRLPYIKLKKEKTHRLRVLTKTEENTLIQTLREIGNDPRSFGNDIADLVMVLIDTGMRVGEALQLVFLEHIDLEQDVIQLFPEMTKSGEPRNIPMTKRVRQILTDRSKKYRKGRLFPFKNYYISKVFRKARKRMGLETDKEFVPHALRHACASRMVRKGVDLYVVKDILGHSSITVTERYAHLNVERLRKGIQTLEENDDNDDR